MAVLESRGQRLHYDVIDLTAPWVETPETILFHHGVGANGRCWRGWAPALLDRYRLVTFDLAGHGRSQPVEGEISIAAMAGDVTALADKVAAQRFHLVGESIGGTVALQTAIAYPERLLSLTVSNGAHLGGTIQNLDFWHEVIEGAGMAAWSDRMMAHRFFDGALAAPAWQWYRDQQASAHGTTVLGLLAALVGTDLSAQVPGIAAPTLLLHPDSSPFIPVSVAAQLHGLLTESRLHVLPHVRHGMPFSHAPICGQTLRRFLDDLPA